MDEEGRNLLDEKVSLHKADVNEVSRDGSAETANTPPSVNQGMPNQPIPPVNQGMQSQQVPPMSQGMPNQPLNQGMPNQAYPPMNQGIPNQPYQSLNQGIPNQPIPSVNQTPYQAASPYNNGMPYQQVSQGMLNQQIPPYNHGMQNQQIPPYNNGMPNQPLPQSQMYHHNQQGYGGGKETAPRGMAIASMVLGIVGIVLCAWFIIGMPCAIVGLILGCMFRSKGGRDGMATAGIICSSIGLGLGVLQICFFIMNIGYWMWY